MNKETVKQMLSEDKTEAVIAILMKSDQDSDILIALSSQLKRLNSELSKGIIEREKFWLKKNQINDSLFKMLENQKPNSENAEDKKVQSRVELSNNKIQIEDSKISNLNGDINIGSINSKL